MRVEWLASCPRNFPRCLGKNSPHQTTMTRLRPTYTAVRVVVTYFDRTVETAPREHITRHQIARARTLLREVLASNAFYQEKLRAAGFRDANDFTSLHDLPALPFTTKQDFVDDQSAHPPYGSNLTYALDRYQRLHQTSGTTGQPMRWLDTRESWAWWARCWGAVYRAAGMSERDRIFFAFSFGPFIGFWAAFAGAEEIGAMAISGGAQHSLQRVTNVMELRATGLCCTPSYALHLAEVAANDGIALKDSAVERIVVAGEPGGSIPGTKARIEAAWGAEVFDHAGATEVGAFGFTCVMQNGMHLHEGEFIVEVIDPRTGKDADEGELVVTNLDRLGSPVIRYKTGDRVRLNHGPCACGRTFVRTDGGIIGRIDQMLTVRGVNIFPSAIEAIVRAHPAVQEFAVVVDRVEELDQLELQVEVADENPRQVAERIAQECAHGLGLRVKVSVAAENSLPRFELKAKRVTDRRAGR
jgi:phenylacetate-CoA ligase